MYAHMHMHIHLHAHVHTRTHIIYTCSGLGLEEEVPDYDLDSEDDEWLSAQTNERVGHLKYIAYHA